jgi:hypothetical protein
MLDDLRGVLVGPKTDGDIRVRLVELFDDGLRVHWSARIPQPESGDAKSDLQARTHAYIGFANKFTLTDDLGTEYVPAGGGGGGGEDGIWRGDRWFGTSVPPSATTLTVTIADAVVTLRLADAATPPD